jgi:outer membrane protein
MKTRFRIPLLVVALMTSPVVAAEKTFSWSELVEKTKENNEDLLSSERSLKSAEYSVKGSYYNYFPQLSASVSGNQGTTDDYGVSVTATQNVFSGFQDSGKVAQIKANYDLAVATLQSTRAKVSYDLKSAVADLVYAQSYVKLAKGIIERRELNLKMVQLRFDGGRENKGSLLLSKAYLEDARLDFIQANQALSVAQSRLAKILGEEGASNYILNGKIPMANPPDDVSVEFPKLVLETPTYRSAIAQEAVAKAALTQSESGFYPSVNLTATTNQYGSSWYPDQNRWSVGASLTFPIFNGGRDYFSTRSAIESLKASTLNKGSALKDQIVKLKDAFAGYTQAVQKLKVDGAYVDAAEVREKISRQKYNNGLSTFDDWDIIESDLIHRQKSFLQSEHDRIVAEAAWDQVQGKGVL